MCEPWNGGRKWHKHATGQSSGKRRKHECWGLTTLMAVRVNDSLELEVMDPKEYKGDVEQEKG